MPEGRIAVSTTPVLLAQSTRGRLNLRFQADPAANTQNVAIKHTRQVAVDGPNCGLIMTPGTIISLNHTEDNDINDAWYGVAVSGTQYIIVNIRGR